MEKINLERVVKAWDLTKKIGKKTNLSLDYLGLKIQKPINKFILPTAAFSTFGYKALDLKESIEAIALDNKVEILQDVGLYGYFVAENVIPESIALTTLALSGLITPAIYKYQKKKYQNITNDTIDNITDFSKYFLKNASMLATKTAKSFQYYSPSSIKKIGTNIENFYQGTKDFLKNNNVSKTAKGTFILGKKLIANKYSSSLLTLGAMGNMTWSDLGLNRILDINSYQTFIENLPAVSIGALGAYMTLEATKSVYNHFDNKPREKIDSAKDVIHNQKKDKSILSRVKKFFQNKKSLFLLAAAGLSMNYTIDSHQFKDFTGIDSIVPEPEISKPTRKPGIEEHVLLEDRLIFRSKYDKKIRDTAIKNKLNYHIFNGVLRVESQFNEKAISRAGAVSLGQMTKDAVRYMNYNAYINNPNDPNRSNLVTIKKPKGKKWIITGKLEGKYSWEKTVNNPDYNIEISGENLKLLKEIFDGDILKSLGSYNGGFPSVQRAARKAKTQDYWKLQKYLQRETKDYVKQVMAYAFMTENFSFPTHGTKISSGWGPRYVNKIVNGKRIRVKKTHNGIDIKTIQRFDNGTPKPGEPILASGDGVVSRVNWNKKYNGYCVEVMHGDLNWGLYTRYLHGEKDSVIVKAGQKVKKGQTLMGMGNTGRSRDVHLHYEIDTAKGSINPNTVFAMNANGLIASTPSDLVAVVDKEIVGQQQISEIPEINETDTMHVYNDEDEKNYKWHTKLKNFIVDRFDTFVQAIKPRLNPKITNGYLNGNKLRTQGNCKEAIDSYKLALAVQGIEKETIIDDIYEKIGLCYDTMGDKEKAKASFEKGISYNGDRKTTMERYIESIEAKQARELKEQQIKKAEAKAALELTKKEENKKNSEKKQKIQTTKTFVDIGLTYSGIADDESHLYKIIPKRDYTSNSQIEKYITKLQSNFNFVDYFGRNKYKNNNGDWIIEKDKYKFVLPRQITDIKGNPHYNKKKRTYRKITKGQKLYVKAQPNI